MGVRLGVLGSVALHAGALALLVRAEIPAPPVRVLSAAQPQLPQVPIGLVLVNEGAVVVTTSRELPPPVALPAGPADVAVPWSSSPLPDADVDIPDPRRAGPGGGGTGASEAWTARHDREELRSQEWNDPTRYRIPRVTTARDRKTSEAIARLPEPGIDASQRTPSRRARRARLASSAQAAGSDAGEIGNAATSARAIEGTSDPRPATPLVTAGAAAVEAREHGPVRDDVSAAQASNERDPQPFDLTRARADGDAGHGVSGPRATNGPSAASDRGDGDGATTLEIPLGQGPMATRARLQDAYFRLLYARVLERVIWPRRLALTFEQGEVVVRFTLGPAGSIDTLAIDRSSGFSEFDDAVVTAIRSAAPFGPPPAALATPGHKLQVSAPFVFDNPMIR
jgi:TonB family protein